MSVRNQDQSSVHGQGGQKAGTADALFGPHLVNGLTDFIVGTHNIVFRTDDGGNTEKPWPVHVGNPQGLHRYGFRAVAAASFVAGKPDRPLPTDTNGQRFGSGAPSYRDNGLGLPAADHLKPVFAKTYGLRAMIEANAISNPTSRSARSLPCI